MDFNQILRVAFMIMMAEEQIKMIPAGQSMQIDTPDVALGIGGKRYDVTHIVIKRAPDK